MNNNYFTENTNFYGSTSPKELLMEYGSPLYVYNEKILRQRCREMADLVTYPNFKANFSIKANSNIELLKIVHSEGLYADAMSPGEIYVLLKAGFKPEEIFYVSNNVSEEEMKFAIERGIITSVDSLSQLRQFGRLNPGGKVAIRFNPGIGAGHHEKVVTGGKKTKFGINPEYIDEVKSILKEYSLKLVGVNQHIGSLFMEPESYIESTKYILGIAEQFEDLDFIDFGGGFGIPYRKQEGQQRLDLAYLGEKLDDIMDKWTDKYGKKVFFKTEPGRYIVAECGVLLGTVYSVKQNNGICFVGTDIGFNVLIRPAMYDSHHDIEVYKNASATAKEYKTVTVVGNICESGDIIAKDRLLPQLEEGDIIGVMDAGAYGYSMSSNYNNRLRPAEVLIKENGTAVLIRRRDTLEDLLRNYEIK
ncbi:MAG TPA: diaminopimelate decarboxylase [Clostridiaceae bacterium]|nr:diaminopimelate decarboxylase [Clostridiaceae bacterium]